MPKKYKYLVSIICPGCKKIRTVNKHDHKNDSGFRLCLPCSKKVKSTEERFLEKMQRMDHDECWLWVSTKDKDGYGIFKLDGRDVKAHRVSWQLSKGSIPPKFLVLHKCDNPSCVNPNHLFLGTPMDNMQDKIKKGRAVYSRGSQLPQAKLLERDVLEIRSIYDKGGMTRNQLASEYGVSTTNISMIVNFRTWKHLEIK